MSIWEILGIDQTDDAAAIRRAYTIQLKAIDMDAEPHRFVALRDAYDAARSGTPETPRPFPIEQVEPTPKLDRLATPTLAAGATTGADRVGIQRLAGRILYLLHGSQPIGPIEEELTDLTLRMIAEVDRETVDRQVDAEEWIAETIAANLPRSDAMVHPAVASFRWQDRRHGQYRPDKATIVIDRMRDLNFAQLHVLSEDGRHHLAWWTLQAPPPQGRFQRPDLHALAALGPFFREAGDMPRVATVQFDPEVVAQWHAQLRRHHLALDHWRKRQKMGLRFNIGLASCGFVVVMVIAGFLAALFL